MGITNNIPPSRLIQPGVIDNAAARPASKVCTSCGEEKNFSDYYKKPGGRFGLNARCKPCHTEATMAWAKRNPETTTAIRKRYTQNHKEELAERWSKYYSQNKKQVLQRKNIHRKSTTEQRAEYQKNWYKNNPTKGSEYANRRRVRIQDGDVRTFTAKDWQTLLTRFDNRCAYCGSQEELTKDHIVPISRGGRHSVGNIIPACWKCNMSKGTKFIVEWKAAS
jgi:5-methylcytosine-specific restriction endonuclease McrA